MIFLVYAKFLLTALIAVAETSTTTDMEITKSILPGKVHEECMALDSKVKLNYAFNSDQTVNFNIHYHDKKDAFYPVKKDQIRKENGTFSPQLSATYCLMWTNPHKTSISLSYSFVKK